MDIYSVIFEYCRQKGISVRELERQCSFPQGSIRRWVSVSPGIDKVAKVADVLGCTIDELCGREPPENPQNDDLILNYMEELRQKPHEDLTDDEQLVLRKFRALSAADKYEILMHLVRLEDKSE